jgi:hypothetical protein
MRGWSRQVNRQVGYRQQCKKGNSAEVESGVVPW